MVTNWKKLVLVPPRVRPESPKSAPETRWTFALVVGDQKFVRDAAEVRVVDRRARAGVGRDPKVCREVGRGVADRHVRVEHLLGVKERSAVGEGRSGRCVVIGVHAKVESRRARRVGGGETDLQEGVVAVSANAEAGDDIVAETKLRDEIDDALAGVSEAHAEVAVKDVVDGWLSARSFAFGRPEHVTGVGVGDVGHLSDEEIARRGDERRGAVMIGEKRKGGRDDGPLVLDAAVVGVGHEVSGGAETGAPPRGFVVGGIGCIQTGAAGIELEDLRLAASADGKVDAEFKGIVDRFVVKRDEDGVGDDRLGAGGSYAGPGQNHEDDMTDKPHEATMENPTLVVLEAEMLRLARLDQTN